MNIYYANTIAQSIGRQLAPFCEPGYLHLAGSLRRKVEDIDNIDLLCLPLKYRKESTDLFGEITSSTDIIHPEFEKIVKCLGEVKEGRLTGRTIKIKMVHDIHGKEHDMILDLHMPRKADYFRQLAIKTGTPEFVKRYIHSRSIAKGWCSCNGELRLQRECYEAYNKVNKKVWVLKSDIANPTLPPEWPSEEAFFKWLGVQWYNPEHRNL